MSLGEGGAEGGRAALRALAHPVRLQIMSLLTGASLTAAEVARELGLTHANASYHLRNLLSGGLIVVAGEEKIRGGLAKRYRYDTDREPVRGPDPQAERRAEFAALAHELIRRSGTARFVEGAGLGADGDFWVDPETWLAIRDRICEAVNDLHRAARPPRTAGTVRTSTTVAMFQLREEQE
ncbi:helix-turn-helix domain-containing protein [Actinoplanes sp. NEAU-A12]|uniref:Helix-turn-helix domain-containing protein n=1 Tax=Actinoplanes sandaracinus TaxID=3045177 RepID=A0ABT6WT12_9ACTN|nr:helix-turn-helix domain-containing protein [Actinoplanes sandaracinus]MDI6102855.1 helix-turn-helix domain-containing protein [Actinoplanes sandaracinus]